MEYIIVEDGVIKAHRSAKTIPSNAIPVPDNFKGVVGQKLSAFTEGFTDVKPLSQQIAEGIITLPEGHKVNDIGNEIVRMTQEELNSIYPVKHYAVNGEFYSIAVNKTFDATGNLGYFHPDNAVEMSGSQPSSAHKAVDGVWVFDAEEGKAQKREALKTAFADVSKSDRVKSAVGFDINANETAAVDVAGLLSRMNADDSVSFRAYDNNFYVVSKSDVETMQKEIAERRQYMRQLKWQIEKQIDAADSAEQLDAIIIDFAE